MRLGRARLHNPLCKNSDAPGAAAPPPVERAAERMKQHDAQPRARGVFASLRGSALRVSPNVYNDERDAEALIAALRAAAGAGATAA